MGIRIANAKKFFYLRQIAAAATKTGATLRATVLAFQAQLFTPSFVQGRLVISNQGGGQSGSFQMAGGDNTWTQDNIAGMLEEFVQQIDLTVSQGTPDSSDPDLIETLLNQVIADISAGNTPQLAVTQQMGDFSGLNFPASSTI